MFNVSMDLSGLGKLKIANTKVETNNRHPILTFKSDTKVGTPKLIYGKNCYDHDQWLINIGNHRCHY